MRHLYILSLFLLIDLIWSSAEAQTNSASSLLTNAIENYERYDFTQAARDLAAAKKALRKDESLPAISTFSRRLETARNFLSRIEKIEILDSISVPEAEFFKAYRLPLSSGSLGDASAIPMGIENRDELLKTVEYVFSNEEGDFKMWAQPIGLLPKKETGETDDEEESDIPDPSQDGLYTIVESSLLTDGSWSEPAVVPDRLRGGANAEFPFMMADGVTLYFAADGEESMGGYDIFVATRDATTGEYLQPQNIGMPYNSPSNDYLLSIDELNGVGWWATDRNAPDDSITIYLFKVNDFRANYDADEDEDTLISYARIDDYKSTLNPDSDYSELLATVKAIKPVSTKKEEFRFILPGNRVYTNMTDFNNSSSRQLMKEYISASSGFDKESSRLRDLRRKYALHPDRKLGEEILGLEKKIENDRKELRRLRNAIYKAES